MKFESSLFISEKHNVINKYSRDNSPREGKKEKDITTSLTSDAKSTDEVYE